MAEDEYDKLRESLCSSDPRLQASVLNSPPGTRVPWAQCRARVLALRLGPDGLFGTPTEYTSASALAADLNKGPTATAETASGDPSRCLYLLEGLGPEFVSLLGTHFQLHPSVFMGHERLVPAGGRLAWEGGGIPFLPSTILGRDHVALKYHEPLVLSPRPTGLQNLCDTSGRHIAVTRLKGKISEVGVCRRKCTFWSKSTAAGGWNCLIICDPPIRRVLIGRSYDSGSDVVTSPYGYGYLDFMPLLDQMKAHRGPPRSCLTDDLLFYLQNHCDALGDLSEPKSLRVFVDKIVASHFLKLAEFIQTNMEVVQWKLSRKQDLNSFDVSVAEGLWSDVQSWQRRVAEYQDDLGAIMLQLGIPTDTSPDSNQIQSWTDSTVDFQYLERRYQEIRRRMQDLSDAISALGSLAGNRAAARSAELSLQEGLRAAEEARSVKALTALGIVFLPLSLTASILSMSDSYSPGNSMFWVYFAVSFPMIGIVFLVYILIERRWRMPGVMVKPESTANTT